MAASKSAAVKAEIAQLQEKIALLEKDNEKLKNALQSPPEGTFVIAKQTDGNWKGFTTKNRQVLSERQYDPQIVLQQLLVRG